MPLSYSYTRKVLRVTLLLRIEKEISWDHLQPGNKSSWQGSPCLAQNTHKGFLPDNLELFYWLPYWNKLQVHLVWRESDKRESKIHPLPKKHTCHVGCELLSGSHILITITINIPIITLTCQETMFDISRNELYFTQCCLESQFNRLASCSKM